MRPIVIAWLCVPLAAVVGLQAGILIDTYVLRPDTVIHRTHYTPAKVPPMFRLCDKQTRAEITAACKAQSKRT
jgi:hypothetical protein